MANLQGKSQRIHDLLKQLSPFALQLDEGDSLTRSVLNQVKPILLSSQSSVDTAKLLSSGVNTIYSNKQGETQELQRSAHILLIKSKSKLTQLMIEGLQLYYFVYQVENTLWAVDFIFSQGMPDLIIFEDEYGQKPSKEFDQYFLEKKCLSNTYLLNLYSGKKPKRKGENQFNRKRFWLKSPFSFEQLLAKVQSCFQLDTLSDQSKLILDEHLLKKMENQFECEQWIQRFEKVVIPLLSTFGLNLETVAEEMCISVSNLHRKAKSITGKTPMNLIKECKMQKAKEMLENDSQISIKYLSHSLGYKSAKNFSKNFKKRFHYSPSNYPQHEFNR